MEIVTILIAAFAVMLASLTGVIFVWNSFGTFLQRNLRYLVSFAAGVFIIVSYSLFSEALELSPNTLFIILGGILGAATLEFVTRLIPTTHHHHGTENDHEHTRTDARRVLLGDAVHNIADGMLLVPAFIVDIRFGIATTFAIFLHEAVQEISEFFILKQAGYSTIRALTLNFLVSATILLGVGFGLFVASVPALMPALIAFAAGAFLYVVFRDLLPSSIRAIVRNDSAGKHLAAAALGVLVMFGVNAATPHSHDHGGHDHHSEEHHEEPDAH